MSVWKVTSIYVLDDGRELKKVTEMERSEIAARMNLKALQAAGYKTKGDHHDRKNHH